MNFNILSPISGMKRTGEVPLFQEKSNGTQHHEWHEQRTKHRVAIYPSGWLCNILSDVMYAAPEDTVLLRTFKNLNGSEGRCKECIPYYKMQTNTISASFN